MYAAEGAMLINRFLLKKKKQAAKAVGLIKVTPQPSSLVAFPNDSKSGYEPFLSDGFVALPGGEHPVPVRILCDSGAALSLLLEGVLPMSEESKTSTSVLVCGFEMGSAVVPLHRIELKSNVVNGSIAVGICKSLPIPDVTFILGNDIGRGNVWKNDGEVLPHVAVPVKPLFHQCTQQHPDVFPACAVTRAMAACSSSSDGKEGLSSPVDLNSSDSFCDLSDSDTDTWGF
ncbi:hypothetical protein JOB18_045213 [Solea senegalensis]|uniref:Uncharacterized protein n=1 Tax=Solea senegalensis TaxID=28829 RepID=A0AAV6PUG4_SOLSE|nr:hypothetical protein JOB18_045213 [Solea senegalensis]